MAKNKVAVDFKNETFEAKVVDLIDGLERDLKDLRKQNKFHALIVETFKDSKDAEIVDCVKVTSETLTDTMKLIDRIEERLKKSNLLKKFLQGDLVLDLDGFAMLMIEVLGSQMVNYIELKNEHIAVSKKWKVK